MSTRVLVTLGQVSSLAVILWTNHEHYVMGQFYGNTAPGAKSLQQQQKLLQLKAGQRQLNAAFLPGIGTYLHAVSPGPPVTRPARDMSERKFAKDFIGEDGSKCSYVQMKGASLPGKGN